MFSPHLFNHKYDIDDLLAALCGPTPVWIETQTGTLSSTPPAGIPASHIFQIEPLPAGFIQELINSPEQTHLSDIEKADLHTLLQSTTIQQLPSHFPQGRLGGWIRERVKDAALEWLDLNDLIPPSMRHINRAKATKLYNSRTVTIEDTE